jgi:hypothetical protein
MKKMVRYAAGIAGAAVPALGLMIPVAAAAATAQRPAVGGKTVTLLQHHETAIAAGCTGSSEVHASTGKGHVDNQGLTYWWTKNIESHTCIGTVKGQVSNASLQAQTLSFRTRAYLDGHMKVSKQVHGTCFKTGLQGQCTGDKASIGVHQFISGPTVNVCGAWLWATGPFKGTEAFTPVCKSVP